MVNIKILNFEAQNQKNNKNKKMELLIVYTIIYGSALLGVIWALINYIRIKSINVNLYLLAPDYTDEEDK